MSAFFYFASDKPFKELLNPHEKIISINEAISLGAEIPDYVLELDLDRDKTPMLYMDRKIRFNKETKELEDGDFDDDFSIRPVPSEDMIGLYTDKPFFATVEIHRYTEGRGKSLLPYITEHMQTTDEMEIWYGWLDDVERPTIKIKEVPFSQLSEILLKEINETHPTIKPLVHYCWKIQK